MCYLMTLSGADNIRIGPQARKFPLQYCKLLPQQPGRTSFDQLDKPLHVIRHHFQFLDLGLILLAYPRADLFHVALDGFHEHLSPLLRTPDDMSMTCRGHMLTAPVRLAHRIQYTAPHFYRQEHLFYALPPPPMPQIRIVVICCRSGNDVRSMFFFILFGPGSQHKLNNEKRLLWSFHTASSAAFLIGMNKNRIKV